jgi:hypothetical protein
MVPDNVIKRALNGYNRIVILGCEGCANDSLAYTQKRSQKARFDEHMKQNMPAPDAILEEANRLKTILHYKANDIHITTGSGLCSNSTSNNCDWIKICDNAEVVLALSCMAGILGIKASLGKSVKVIPGMKTVGVLYSHRKYDPENGLLHLDMVKSVAVYFKNNSNIDEV